MIPSSADKSARGFSEVLSSPVHRRFNLRDRVMKPSLTKRTALIAFLACPLFSCWRPLTPQEYINNLYETSAFGDKWSLVYDLDVGNDYWYRYWVFDVGENPPSDESFSDAENVLFEERYKNKISEIGEYWDIDSDYWFDFKGDYRWFWHYYGLARAYDFASTMDLAHVSENNHCEVLALYSVGSGYVYAIIKDGT